LNCSIDATNNTRLGRYINDAPVRDPECNCLPKAYYIDGVPHILVFAAKDILADEELRYDYGTGDLPWQTNKKVLSSPYVESDAVLNVRSTENLSSRRVDRDNSLQVQSTSVDSDTALNVTRVESHAPQTSVESDAVLNVRSTENLSSQRVDRDNSLQVQSTSVDSDTPLNVTRVESHAPQTSVESDAVLNVRSTENLSSQRVDRDNSLHVQSTSVKSHTRLNVSRV